jgi:hypothetical protein
MIPSITTNWKIFIITDRPIRTARYIGGTHNNLNNISFPHHKQGFSYIEDIFICIPCLVFLLSSSWTDFECKNEFIKPSVDDI